MFFASDHHLMHEKILTFTDTKGNLLRPFKNIDEHDDTIIANHNKLVSSTDIVYMLGDVTWKFNAKAKEKIAALNGRKYLVAGNHDNLKWLYETGLFEDMFMWKYLPEHSIILSHCPIHFFDFKRAKVNVHGHLHSERMLDPRYFNVSLEQTNFSPIDLEDVLNDKFIVNALHGSKI